jgi:adenosylcobinamide kinase / adenosylcobinamide-phosphate guanylyltransferase
MALTFLVGGARSGKSALAVRMAALWAGPVLFVATARVEDEEMAERIDRHRRARPPEWTTVEEPLEVVEAVRAASVDAFVVLDCLSLWVSNLLAAGWDDEAIEEAAAVLGQTAAAREASTVVVSNEVGLGVVPMTVLGRRYRDVLGRVNALFAEEAVDPLFVVAGRTVRLEPWA